MTKPDSYADLRGTWAPGWVWRCDCPNKWPEKKRRCSRCGVLRPLRSSPVVPNKPDPLRMGGFMNFSER